MKEITVKSYKNEKGSEILQGGNKFTVKPVIGLGEAKQCAIHFVEVEPNNFAFGYHYHEMNEEAFYIISGTGVVRTQNGEIEVKAGDVITFPSGPSGAHCIRNSSDVEKLVYIDFDTINIPDLVHFPDTKKVMYEGPYSKGIFDEQ